MSYLLNSIATTDLLMLLRQRDLSSALSSAMSRFMEASRAEGCALCYVAARPLTLRLGHLPPEALAQVEQWERALLQRGERGPIYADLNAQAILSSGQTLLKMPLNGPEVVAGIVALLLPESITLSDEQLAVLRELSHLVGHLAALLGTLTTMQQRLERLGLVYEIGQALTSTLDLQALLRDTMQLAATAMNAQASSLMLLDPQDPSYLVFEIAYGARRDHLRRYRMSVHEGIAGWVVQHGQPIISNFPDRDPRFNRVVDLRTGFLTRNVICVPLTIKGETIGVLQVLNKSGGMGFDDDDLELLMTVSAQAAIGLENARLYRNLREERDRILSVQEEVRRELARELHDGLVQSLAAMSMSLEYAKRLSQQQPERLPDELESLHALTTSALREGRLLLFGLRPLLLETQGLAAALQSYVERLNQDAERRSGTVELLIEGELPRLAPTLERTIFAILQEAINNARKHAAATHIQVSIATQDGLLCFQVEDDGTGFDLATINSSYAQSGSLGLVNMRERAKLIDSELTLTSSPATGTCIVLCVPAPLVTSPS